MRTRAMVCLLLSILLAGCALGARRVPFETVAHGYGLSHLLQAATSWEGIEEFFGPGPYPAFRLLMADGTDEVQHLLDNVVGCTKCEGPLTDALGMVLCVTCEDADPEGQVVAAAFMLYPVVLPERYPLEIRTIRWAGDEVRLVAYVRHELPGELTAQAVTYAYHVVAIPRERLPEGSVTFVLVDEGGEELARGGGRPGAAEGGRGLMEADRRARSPASVPGPRID